MMIMTMMIVGCDEMLLLLLLLLIVAAMTTRLMSTTAQDSAFCCQARQALAFAHAAIRYQKAVLFAMAVYFARVQVRLMMVACCVKEPIAGFTFAQASVPRPFQDALRFHGTAV